MKQTNKGEEDDLRYQFEWYFIMILEEDLVIVIISPYEAIPFPPIIILLPCYSPLFAIVVLFLLLPPLLFLLRSLSSSLLPKILFHN